MRVQNKGADTGPSWNVWGLYGFLRLAVYMQIVAYQYSLLITCMICWNGDSQAM
jgi:hypothetical protein